MQDWLDALRRCCPPEQMQGFLDRAGMTGHGRVTLDQIVRLYQIAAVETGDEMMGLWSRPVRARALQHLMTTVREASTLPAALHRFSTFWNLLLDDYQLVLQDQNGAPCLSLQPRGPQIPQRFGHVLMLKLAHGLLSWLAGHEVPVRAVQFAFDRPGFAADYAVIFPSKVRFGAEMSAICFDLAQMGPPQPRSSAQVADFLNRAPRDWIFTGSLAHAQSLQIRGFLYRSAWESCHLERAAQLLNVTPRTLMRRLQDEGTSFQAIKDGLRRDIAIRDLQEGQKSIEEISQDLGFSSAANFHRAFRRWTGATPGTYRQHSLGGAGLTLRSAT